MNITKGEIKEFLESFGEIHKIEDRKLNNSLSELTAIVNNFFLFGRPSSYVLLDWEIDDALRMKSVINSDLLYSGYPNHCDLYPYFISFRRKKQLELIL